MTPQEKAKELVDRFIPYCTYNKDGLVIPMAKQCALIAVDEVINSRPVLPSTAPQITLDRCCLAAKEFWQQVKQEINKL